MWFLSIYWGRWTIDDRRWTILAAVHRLSSIVPVLHYGISYYYTALLGLLKAEDPKANCLPGGQACTVGQCRCTRATENERCDVHVYFVNQPQLQQFGNERASAFHHQTLYAQFFEAT